MVSKLFEYETIPEFGADIIHSNGFINELSCTRDGGTINGYASGYFDGLSPTAVATVDGIGLDSLLFNSMILSIVGGLTTTINAFFLF